MLDDRTKALVKAIGLNSDQPGDFEQPQRQPHPRLQPEPEPEPEAVDGHTFAAGSGQFSVRSEADGVAELEQSYLAAVITAQKLAEQMLEMTNRWVAVLDDRDEERRTKS